jgi:hypothetical protein
MDQLTLLNLRISKYILYDSIDMYPIFQVIAHNYTNRKLEIVALVASV